MTVALDAVEEKKLLMRRRTTAKDMTATREAIADIAYGCPLNGTASGKCQCIRCYVLSIDAMYTGGVIGVFGR